MSQLPLCLVCHDASPVRLGRTDPPSLNSLGAVHPAAADITFCDRCGHLQTTPLADARAFYERAYAYHTGSLDEDRLLVPPDGPPRYETEVQAERMLARLSLRPGARVLDYGCGKGNTVRRAAAARPDLDVHLYDVTDRYVEFWRQFCPPDNWSVGTVPAGWRGRFDLVASFYVFEHVARPAEALREIAPLLAPGGRLYVMVPDAYQNPADLLAVDHTHHYSEASLRHLLGRAGFAEVEVAAGWFPPALVAVAGGWSAGRSTGPLPPAEVVAGLRERANGIVAFWRSGAERLRREEAALPPNAPVAVYGAGVYGAYVYTRLARPERVACFVDRNPFLNGREYYGRPVVPPDALDPAVRHVLVGLNPGVARRAMADVAAWRGRAITYIYLDEP